MVENFIKKWDTKPLPDAGECVSRGYGQFQNALIKEIKAIAESIGAKLVSSSKGHYFTSFFVLRNGKFVYILHDSAMQRYGDYVKIDLGQFLVRSTKSASDYYGGSNFYTDMTSIKNCINRLLNR